MTLRHAPSSGRWAGLFASRQADALKERELLPSFLTDFFDDILGYAGPSDRPGDHTISREQIIRVDGNFPDAVIGRFRPSRCEFIVAIEGQGTKDPLDRPYAGRRMSAIDQAYRYAINLPCDWIVVTSMRETRLYYKGADHQTYERFETQRLTDDESLLKKFVFLLGAARVVPSPGECHLYRLLNASVAAGRELGRAFHLRSLCGHAPRCLRASVPRQPAGSAAGGADRDAEAELNDRVYRLFDLNAEERKLLQREVEH